MQQKPRLLVRRCQLVVLVSLGANLEAGSVSTGGKSKLESAVTLGMRC